MQKRGVYVILLVVLLSLALFVYVFREPSLTGYFVAVTDTMYSYEIGPYLDFDTLTACLFYINGTEDSCTLGTANVSYAIEGTWNDNLTSYNRTDAELAYEFSDLNSSFTANLTFDSSVISNNGTFCGSLGCNYAQNVSLANRTLNTISTAVKFDGVSGFLNSSVSTAALGSSTFTISAWVNMTNYTSCANTTCIIVSQVNATLSGFALGINNNTGGFSCINFGARGTVSGNISSGITTTGKWHHVACIGNETNRTSLYVDGTYIGKANYTGVPVNATIHVGGTNRAATSTYLNGTLDSVIVWNRSLNSSEISQMAYGRLERYNIRNSYTSSSGYSVIFIGLSAGKSNVSINCKGAELIGNGTDAMAIRWDSGNNGSISNCIITNFSSNSGIISVNGGNYMDIINNTIRNTTGVIGIGIVSSGSLSNIVNNTIENVTTGMLISGNKVNITYNTIINSANGTYISGTPSKNITIVNNSFINLTRLGILLNQCNSCRILNNTFDNVSGQYPLLIQASVNNLVINISLNIFKNINSTTNSTFIGQTAGANISIWLNSFYSNSGIHDRRTTNQKENSYCINNQGNFYEENIVLARRGNGTAGSDCGLVNLTNPESSEILINSTYLINWTKQDAARSITYALYYTNDSGTRYYFLANATILNYTLQINNSLREANGTYLIRMVPVSEGVNGTNDNSITAFSIDPNDPSVSITQSATGDMSLGETKTVTCSSSDTMGISSVSMTLDTKSCSSTSGCTISYTAATTGTKTASCTAVDSSTRTKSTSVSFSVTSSPSGSSGGGGGGGGGGTRQFDIDFTTEIEATLSKSEGNSVSFTLDGSIKHEIIFTKVEATGITLTIQSTPKLIDLKIGEVRNVDVDSNGIYDLAITLREITSSGFAKVDVKKIVLPVSTIVTNGVVVVSLKENGNANIVINGLQSSLTVTSVGASSTTATIAGKTITLNIGQSENVDLNDDGGDDVKITLTGIINGEAKFEIQKAEARIALEAAEEKTMKELAIKAVKKPGFNLAYIIGLAALVAVLVLVWLIHHYRHGRHIKEGSFKGKK